MKTRLLIVALLLNSLITFSQNIWIGEGTDTNWTNVDNWSIGEVPIPSDNVIIPTGFNVNADSNISVLSITVEGNSVLNVQNGIAFSNPSVFRQNTTINYFDGNINGNGSLLTSEGTINVLISNLFSVTNSTTLNNLGTINFIAGFIGITGDSVLNNSGTIDIQTDNFMISQSSSPNVLNNTGLIRTSFPNQGDEAFIACPIINTGTIQVEIGTLNLNIQPLNLAGGLYNVASGATLNWNGPTTVSGILSGNVFGDLNWNDDLIVPTTAFFNFGGNGVINCTGDLEGGGTLTNQTTINQIGGSALAVSGSTTLDNESVIQITNGPGISIGLNSVINNRVSGIIDIIVDGGNINSIGVVSPSELNNSGLIRVNLPNSTDQSILGAQLNNNNGTIQLDTGELLLFNENTTLTNGIYNIATNATLLWTLPISISGSLSGVLNGTIAWSNDLNVPVSASFDFNGNGNVEWNTQFLTGGGILTNNHVIETISGSNKIIDGATTLLNNGEIKSGGFVRIDTNSTLNNTAQGIINIEVSSSSFGRVNSSPHTFINSGSIIASHPSGSAFISAPLNNFGIIEATTAEIDFSNTLVNEASGIITGDGIIDLPPSGNFTNNGVFAPGNSPGSLTVLGDYVSTPTSILNIELNGLTQETEYDLLAITGSATLEGDIQIALGFDANVNDEFIVATTTNTVNSCNLPSTVTASFDGFTYEFDVACRNNDELVLTITGETLGLTDFEENSEIKFYPNPTSNWVYFSDKSINNIKIYDLSGKLIISTNSYSISTSNIQSGLYLIKATNSKNISIIQKLIKK